MSYRKILVTLLAITLAPLALSAQPPQGDRSFRGDWGEDRLERSVGPRLERLIEYLELSDAQAIEIEEIMNGQRAARRTAHQTRRADGDALRALIESEQPDPTLVGQRVLAMHAGREAMRQQGEADRERIRSALTPDQVEKFDALMAAREMEHDRGDRGRAGRRGPHGQRPGRPGGPPPTDG